MKHILAICLILVFASFTFAVSMTEVIRLSKMKTGDDLILQLIQKKGLDKPITSQDVVYLKEKGVSDRVIAYMWKLSNPEKESLSENVRSYSTTTRKGKTVKVYTNLDENGKRMGGEVLPQPEALRVAQEAPQYEEPREIRVVVEQPPAQREEPQQYYVEDRLNSSDYYNGYYPYVPYYPNQYPRHYPNGRFRPNNSSQNNWHVDAGYGRPRPPMQPRQAPSSPGSKPAGVPNRH